MRRRKRRMPDLAYISCLRCAREDYTLDGLCAACFSEGDSDKHIKWYDNLTKALEMQDKHDKKRKLTAIGTFL